MDEDYVEVGEVEEEIVVDDDQGIVILPELRTVSPNIIDISDSGSDGSGSEIVEVDSGDEDLSVVGDSESTEDEDRPDPTVVLPPEHIGVPPLPQLPQLPVLPQQPDSANEIPPVGQAPAINISDNPLPGQASPPQQESVSGQDVPSASDVREVSGGREVTLAVPHPPPNVRTVATPQREALAVRPQNSVLNDSVVEFRSPKRKKPNSPPKKEAVPIESDDDSDCCPICFEPWTTSGSHRLASLRCGHLFGQHCIDKWLKGQGGKCPQCNAKAKRQDIRVLYTKSISAVDTTERDRALADLEKEKEARRKAELESAQSRLQYQLSVEECNRLRREVTTVRTQLQQLRSQMGGGHVSLSQSHDAVSQSGVSTSGKKFLPDRTIKIWEGGQCRVLAYSTSLAALIISQPSSSTLFPGFGIKKLSAMDFKTSQYMTIHSKQIRDMCFHPTADNGILLSCGLDKTAKMTSIMSNTVVQTYHTTMPVWSCEWNIDDANYFYTGLSNGSVLEFDVRNTQTHVKQLNTEGTVSPIAALTYIPRNLNAAFRPGGLVVGQLHRTSFFERKGEEESRLNFLPLEGSLTSLSFDVHTRHLLASFRPTSTHRTVRHQVCEMTCTNVSVNPAETNNQCSCNVVHTFEGGRTQSVLSKSALVPNPGDPDNLMVCAGDETSNTIHVWDCKTGHLFQKISTGAFVLDLTSFCINNVHYVAALTEKTLKVNKWC